MPLRKLLPLLSLVAVVIFSVACGGDATTPQSPTGPTPTSSSNPELVVEEVVGGLEVPWELVFAQDGRWFFTERPGRVRVRSADGNLLPEPAFNEPTPNTEAGMLGLEIDRDFANNHRMYLFTCPTQMNCHLLRLVENNNRLTVDRVLLEVSGGSRHMAGRIKIGPDGFLYVGYGDTGIPENSQTLSNLAGKILRMTTDGAPAPGNPFPEQPLVYALGLRDPQGLAWDAADQLYGTDHGESSHDEVNMIFPGRNYGWPTCEGRCGNPAFEDPVKLFFPETALPLVAASTWREIFRNGEIPCCSERWGCPTIHLPSTCTESNFVHPPAARSLRKKCCSLDSSVAFETSSRDPTA